MENSVEIQPEKTTRSTNPGSQESQAKEKSSNASVVPGYVGLDLKMLG